MCMMYLVYGTLIILILFVIFSNRDDSDSHRSSGAESKCRSEISLSSIDRSSVMSQWTRTSSSGSSGCDSLSCPMATTVVPPTNHCTAAAAQFSSYNGASLQEP
ncbi:hypothetical protein SAMD00019534_041630 [Acytostelium subglobosum LB1]|uniref:hypothetical protein n=1 Tax=Acytostelium subglobosum LB1 TaxID=1410327 RepID=UPI000644CFEA|nr:hypothetical protein SAMD00019534_041630 [Acytostelium subglobosum LB1]GAM20988.1 hypothetical protein SAMD00019534_041630 [Acytostelium subglobosum LB1]|eukprot:XP_012756122.1 hypothetical protein SAMD00019534_041630 [Acytostelium subglobosum LB1]